MLDNEHHDQEYEMGGHALIDHPGQQEEYDAAPGMEQQDSVENEIFETISRLNQERMQYEDSGEFMKASKIKEKLQKLGEEFERRKLIELRQNHQIEKENLEADFQRELSNCNDFWNKKIEQYKTQSQTLEEQLIARHSEKIVKHEEELRDRVPGHGKFSPEVLNIEYQIRCLVKEQRYKEADALQRKLEKMRVSCLEKNSEIDEGRIKHLLSKFIATQNNELNVLRKKIESGRKELLKAREKDYQKLVAKYKVLRENQDDAHILEYQKIERHLKLFKPSSNLFNRSYQLESGQN